jgi:hypothetical protein
MQTSDNNAKTVGAGGPPPAVTLMQMFLAPLLQRSICVVARLKIADMLASGSKPVSALAKQTQTNEDALYRVLRLLATAGIFSEKENQEFSLTPLASLLRSDLPDSLYHYAIMMGEDWLWEDWGQLMYCVKTGSTAQEKVHGMDSFQFFAKNKEAGIVFNNAMTNLSQSDVTSIVASYDFSAFHKLVDIAGGHGLALAKVLKANPKLHAVLYELPYVIEGAKEFLEKQGLINQVELLSGDFFESVPAGADAYMMKHIIHDWNDERCIQLLRNIGSAMDKNGKVLIIEMVVPGINIPGPAKMLDLQMLVMEGGKERTKEQFETLLNSAGFSLTNIIPTGSPFSIIEGQLISASH